MANTVWVVLQRDKDVSGATVELRYQEFGKGKAKARYWRIYRDDEYVGYASTPEDAFVNFDRVLSGLTRNPDTGRYE